MTFDNAINILNTDSFFLKILYSYLAGVITSLTPCVYPLIPVTLAIFGAKPQTDRKKSFKLALIFTLGIALSYTSLGLISILSGSIFGQFLGNPIVSFFIFVILFTLGLISLDVVHPKLLSSMQNWAGKLGGVGYKNSFIMGATSGLIAAPCVGPVLILIIGYAASSDSIALSTTLLFSYSIGVGTLFLLLGTYSGLIHRIPKSGNWLNMIKFLIGIGIIYFSIRFLPKEIKEVLSFNATEWHIILLIVISFTIAHFAFRKSNKTFILISCLFSVFALINIPNMNKTSNTQNNIWHSNYDQTLSKANNDDIILIDLYADWCAACIEYEEKTFPDKRVSKKLEEFIKVRIDFTEDNDFTESISEKYNIIGLPTLLFVNNKGEEIPNSRIEGFLDPNEFLEKLNKLKDRPIT